MSVPESMTDFQPDVPELRIGPAPAESGVNFASVAQNIAAEAAAPEQVYNYTHGDGHEFSGTIEQARKLCPALGKMSLESAKATLEETNVANQLAQLGRERRRSEAAKKAESSRKPEKPIQPAESKSDTADRELAHHARSSEAAQEAMSSVAAESDASERMLHQTQTSHTSGTLRQNSESKTALEPHEPGEDLSEAVELAEVRRVAEQLRSRANQSILEAAKQPEVVQTAEKSPAIEVEPVRSIAPEMKELELLHTIELREDPTGVEDIEPTVIDIAPVGMREIEESTEPFETTLPLASANEALTDGGVAPEPDYIAENERIGSNAFDSLIELPVTSKAEFQAEEDLQLDRIPMDTVRTEETGAANSAGLDVPAAEILQTENPVLLAQELPAPIAQVESAIEQLVVEMTEREADEPTEIDSIVQEIISLPAKLETVAERDEVVIEDKLETLFIELFEHSGIAYTPELVESFVELTKSHYLEQILDVPSDVEPEPQALPDEIGTREFLQKLQHGLRALKKSAVHMYQIGKSVLRLYAADLSRRLDDSLDIIAVDFDPAASVVGVL